MIPSRSITRLIPLLAVALCLLSPTLVRAQTFTNPLYTGGGDPYITFANGNYYFLLTNITNEITVAASTSLSTLARASQVGVYNAGQFYESPELYWFGAPYNRWYIYYTEYPSTVKVIESNTTNPQGSYHLKATLTTDTYDASIIKMPSGSLYLVGSTYSNIVIQPMSNPYTVSAGHSNIAAHDQAWETGAIEGPNPLWHNGQLSILYSAGHYNQSDYAVGDLRYTGGNLTVASSWTKLPGPLFTGSADPSVGVYDAGVADPFYSPDGQQAWFAYSDYNVPNNGTNKDPNRAILAQPLYFDAVNNPILGGTIPVSQPIPLPSGDPNGSLLTGAAFTLTNEAGGLNLDNPSGSQQPGAPVLLGSADGLPTQSFLLDAQAFGAYTLTNIAGNLKLEDPDGSGSPGVKALLNAPSASASQQLALVRQSDGTQTLTDAASGLNLDDPSGSNVVGTPVQFYTPNGATAQNWALNAAPDAQGLISGAVYTLTNAAGGLNLDNPSGSNRIGTVLQFYQANDNPAQNWRIEAVGNGVYTLTNIASGALRLDDPSGSSAPGTHLQLYYANTLRPQQYLLRRQPDGNYTVTNVAASLNLDGLNGSQSNGAIPLLEPASGALEQEWTIQLAPNPDGLVSGKSYVVVNEAANLALSVPNSAIAAGTKLDLETYGGLGSQQWRLNLVGATDGATYTLTNVNSGLNLDNPSGSNTPRTQQQLYYPNGQTPQEWQFTEQSDGSYTLANVAGGLNLDNPSGSKTSGVIAQIYTPNTSAAQKWFLRSALAISGVTVSSISDASAAVNWATTNTASTTVRYGATTSYGSTAVGQSRVLWHSAALTGLTPSTTYHYQVASTDAFGQTQFSADYTFTTARQGSPRLSVLNMAASSGGNGLTIAVTLANTGSGDATGLRITKATLGMAATTTTLPLSVGAVSQGATTTLDLDFPSMPSGQSALLVITGVSTGGTFSGSGMVAAPAVDEVRHARGRRTIAPRWPSARNLQGGLE